MSRTKNVLRNTEWGFFQKIVTLLMPFITRTALIQFLGVEYLGLSSLFASILSILGLAELGLSNAIISVMYKPIAENDTNLICALMQFYKKTYYKIGLLVTLLSLIILPFVPNLINGNSPKDINIYILYIIYVLNNALSYFLFAYRNCLFAAHQRNDINSKIQTVIIFLQNAIQLILVIAFKNYYIYVLVIPIFTIITNLTTAFFSKEYYPKYVCKGSIPAIIKNDLKKRVIGILFGRISATIRESIDGLFISAFLGLQMVAIYSNYFYIVNAVIGVIQILENSLVASVGNSIVENSVEKNHIDFSRFTFYLQWIVGWCSICILCLEQPFMEIWVGQKYMLKDYIVILGAIYLFVNCICLIRSIYTQALGIWWQLKYLSIVDIFVNLFLNYFLIHRFGVYGVLLATIIDIVLVSIPWTTYYLFKSYFGLELYWKYILGYVKYFFIMLLVGLFTWSICSIISIPYKMASFIAKCLVCVIVPNVIYVFIFRKNEFFKNFIWEMSEKINIHKRGV